MLHRLVAMRGLIAMGLAATVGAWGLHAHPVDMADPFLGLIEARSPGVFVALGVRVCRALVHHAVLRGFTRALAASRSRRHAAIRACVPDACRRTLQPEKRPAPTLVLGETHFETTSGRAPSPAWLTIPQRGLYTGVMVVGAVGTGKTSACMYPYAEQLLRWRAADADHRDRRPRARSEGRLLQAGARDSETGRTRARLHRDRPGLRVTATTRCTTISTRTRSRTPSPTLLNNLFGKSKEPFWQQAYTDLLKFVILLRRISDGYTTLAEVYHYILEPSKIEMNISKLTERAEEPARSHHRFSARLPGALRPTTMDIVVCGERGGVRASVRRGSRHVPRSEECARFAWPRRTAMRG